VVDVTANVAGPFATRILGQLGADVVKVERPGTGDDTRAWGPPTWDGHGLSFLELNRQKRSVVVDLDDEAGRQQLHELVATADVFVQNLRPGVLARFGFGPDELLARHPALVYCDITGYGPEGPRRDDPAFDPMMQAFTGLMSITGEPGRPPVRIPVSLLDKGTGMWAAIGIMDALRSRDATGRGGLVQTSLLETAFTWASMHVMSYLATGEVPTPLGSGQVGIGSHGAFATADGHVMIAAANDRLWAKLSEALGAPELATDPRFATNAGRVSNRDALVEVVEGLLSTCSTREAIERIARHGVPVGPVNDIGQAVAEEQVRAVGVIEPVEHPEIPGLLGLRLPVRVSNGTEAPSLPPPGLGQHTAEILPGGEA
jgi:crotonobetainyl-CoA:carnitine CoA-transferase CaiB-like acyl-CoA transferase